GPADRRDAHHPPLPARRHRARLRDRRRQDDRLDQGHDRGVGRLRGYSAPARLLDQHRHHAAAQARAYAPDLGGDLGRRVLDPAEAETREVRRQIGGDVDLARREAADQLADDQLPQAAAPLRLEDRSEERRVGKRRGSTWWAWKNTIRVLWQ